MLDKDIQTPLHFVERNFDPNYFWNEWELRKKAIQMANIRKNQTKVLNQINIGIPNNLIEFPSGVRHSDFLEEGHWDKHNGERWSSVQGIKTDEKAMNIYYNINASDLKKVNQNNG